jgi:uncharacterized RDD family membrane protein YckC
MTQLVTGEAVALDLRPAAFPSRLVAGLLDALLQLALLLLLFLATAVAGAGSDAADSAIGVLVLVVVTIVYPVAFETALRGRTPGKAAMGLRVVRDDGGPIAFRQALVRGLAGAFLERPGVTFFFGALVSSLLHPAGKRIGDLLAGTLVLQERVPARGGAVATMPPPLAGWAAQLELSALPDELALQARSFVARSAELTDAAREDLGGRLVAAVLERVDPQPPPGTPGWAVLAAVLAERRRRDEQRLGGPAPVTPPAPAPVTAPSTTPPAPPASTGFTPPG